jgi:hypothetical protein
VRKVLRSVLTLALLVAGYVAYGRAFPVVARLVGRVKPDFMIPYDPSPSRTARMATDLAIRAFGKNHWSADPQNSLRYYDAARGYWMFAQEYERMNEGRRARFTPFAVIIQSSDRKGIKTMRGNSATLDFDKPFDMSKPEGEPAHVVHGRIDENVVLTDDHGTSEKLGDDLFIGPLTYLEYDEANRQIRSESHVILKQGDLDAIGDGVTIDLRPYDAPPGQPPPPGFNGAKTITLFKQVKINVKDVGRSGLVPGGAANAPAKDQEDAEPKAPRPGELTCDGPARFDLPKPLPPAEKAKAPPQPTFAQFYRNVRVRQGSEGQVDQLDGDYLHLTLLPAEKPKPAEGAAPTQEDDGALSGLALQRAYASGHAVWVQSQSETQRLKARGNELTYERHAPVRPDVIYFRGDKYTLAEIYKLGAEGPEKGKVVSIDTIRTEDLTIFQGLKPGDEATLVARGPGTLESRPDSDKPIDHTAKWHDRLEVQTIGEGKGSRRRIVLFDRAEVASPTQATMTATDKIVAVLKPKDPDAAKKPKPKAGAGRTDASGLDWAEGHGKVHLETVPKPDSDGRPHILDARKQLDIVFVSAAAPAPAVTNAPAPASVAPAAQETATPAQEPTKTAEAPKKKPDPPFRALATTVWARVIEVPGTGDQKKWDIQEARLREQVVIHQEPAPGKRRGNDVTGHRVDIHNRGEGKVLMLAEGLPGEPARASTDGRMIEGPKLGVDQATDVQWVQGAGRLVQEAKVEAIDSRTDSATIRTQASTGDEKAKRSTFSEGPKEVRWQTEMRFYGRPPDSEGLPDLAWAWFLGRVRAEGPDVFMSCEQMEVHFDRPIAFSKPPKDPNAPAPPPENEESKTDIEAVHCLDDTDTRLLSRDPRTGELQKRLVLAKDSSYTHGRKLGVNIVKWDLDEATGLPLKKKQVLGHDIVYDKPTGDFEGVGPGLVRLFELKTTTEEPAKTKTAGNGTIRPVSDPGPSGRRVADTDDRIKPGAARPKAAPAPPQLTLTRVQYKKSLKGRFQGGESSQPADGPSQADFRGAVLSIQARVKTFQDDLDPDSPPREFRILRGDVLHIFSEPAPGDAKGQRNLLRAEGGRPSAFTERKHIEGDVIKYDSYEDLFLVFGDDHGVYFGDQDHPGQPVSVGRGRALIYNNKTGSSEVIDPKSIVMIDAKKTTTAGLEEPSGPDDKKDKPKLKRQPLKLTPRNDKERRGFNGR